MSLVGAILAIGLLIIVHEAGHYFVARWCKMRVDRFSVGFGPSILSWRHGETDFTLGPIPFGGFVQINGMTLSDDFEEDDERAYPNRPAWQRFLTIFAGPGTNYLTAVVLALGLYSTVGINNGTFRVDSILPGFDAEGKLLPGDTILSINGQGLNVVDGEIDEVQPLGEWVKKSAGLPMELIVLRDGKRTPVSVTPSVASDPKVTPRIKGLQFCRTHFTGWAACKDDIYMIGVQYGQDRAPVDIFTIVKNALMYPIEQTKTIVGGLHGMLFGNIEGEVVGPVGITSMIKKTIQTGWVQAIELLMMLNVYLGLVNLLPLPALDGGRLIFLSYEMATRRRANPRVEATVHMVGIMALLLLMVVVTYKDIAKLF